VRSALLRSENEARNVVVTGLYVPAFVPNCDRVWAVLAFFSSVLIGDCAG
jgi:hypothetical protein